MDQQMLADLDRRYSRAVKMLASGKRAQAIKAATQLVDYARSRVGERHPLVADVLVLATNLHEAAGETIRAEELMRDSLAVRRFLVGGRDLSLVSPLSRLAGMNLALDRHAIAESLIRESLEICQTRATEHPGLAAIPLSQLSRVHLLSNRPSEAVATVRDALATAEHMQDKGGAEHDGFVASLLLTEAEAHLAMNDAVRAEEAVREAIRLRRQTLGDGNPDVLNAQLTLASVLEALGQLDEADAICTVVADLTRAVAGEFSNDFVTVLSKLIPLRAKTEYWADAQRLSNTAVRIMELAAPANRLGVCLQRGEWAQVLLSRQDRSAALQLLDQATAALRSEGRPGENGLVQYLIQAAATRAEMGDHAGGQINMTEAIQISRQLECSREEVLRTSLAVSMRICHGARDFRSVEKTGLELEKLACASDGENSLGRWVAVLGWADAIDELGREKEAVEVFETAANRLSKLIGDDHPLVTHAQLAPTFVLNRLGRFGDAALVLERAIVSTRKSALLLTEDNAEDYRDGYIGRMALTLALADVKHEWLGLTECLTLHPLATMHDGQRRLRTLPRWQPELTEQVRRLVGIDAQLSAIAETTRTNDPAHLRLQWENLYKEHTGLIDQLSAAAPEYLAMEQAHQIGPEAYLQSLPEGSSLAVFERFSPANPAGTGKNPYWLPPRYVCALVRPAAHAGGRPGGGARLIDLGDAGEIERLMDRAADGDAAALQAFADKVLAPLQIEGCHQLFIAPDGRLAEVDFPGLARHVASMAGVTSIRMLSSSWGALGLLPAATRLAADVPMVVEAPNLDADEGPDVSADRLLPPPRPKWWRRLAERMGFLGTPRPMRPQVQLDPRLPRLIEAPHGFQQDRLAAVKSPTPTVTLQACRTAHWQTVAPGAESVLAVRSPRWLVIAAPWALLPDECPDLERADAKSSLRRRPRQPDCDADGPECPMIRAAVYVESGGKSASLRGGAVTAQAISGMDLTQTECVIFSTPPRLPGIGTTAAARLGLAFALHWAGARCVVLPRNGTDPAMIDTAAAQLLQRLAEPGVNWRDLAAWCARTWPGLFDVFEQADRATRRRES